MKERGREGGREGMGGKQYNIIVSEASFLVHSMTLNFAIYTFQVDHHSVNVLNVSTCI